MTKAEQFIEEHTSNQANISIEISNGGKIQSCSIPWLTPDQARKAVEIAREEFIKQTVDWLTKHAIKYYINSKGFLSTDELVKDYELIMAMKDE